MYLCECLGMKKAGEQLACCAPVFSLKEGGNYGSLKKNNHRHPVGPDSSESVDRGRRMVSAFERKRKYSQPEPDKPGRILCNLSRERI